MLAQGLRDAPTSRPFATYERLRRARVEKVVAAGAQQQLEDTRAAGTTARAALRLVLRYAVTEKNLAWMYDHRINWEQTLAPEARGRYAWNRAMRGTAAPLTLVNTPSA